MALWYEAFEQGAYRSIKLFDDVINGLAYGRATGCGMFGKCQGQLVVEADGSVYPCDFYCLDPWRLGNLARQSFNELLQSPVWDAFFCREHTQPQLCDGCQMARFCGGSL